MIYILYAHFFDYECPRNEIVGIFDSPGILSEMKDKYEAMMLELKQMPNPISVEDLELYGSYELLPMDKWTKYNAWKRSNVQRFESCWSETHEINHFNKPVLKERF